MYSYFECTVILNEQISAFAHKNIKYLKVHTFIRLINLISFFMKKMLRWITSCSGEHDCIFSKIWKGTLKIFNSMIGLKNKILPSLHSHKTVGK